MRYIRKDYLVPLPISWDDMQRNVMAMFQDRINMFPVRVGGRYFVRIQEFGSGLNLLVDFLDFYFQLAKYVIGPQFMSEQFCSMFAMGNWIAYTSEQWAGAEKYVKRCNTITKYNDKLVRLFSVPSMLYGQRGTWRAYADAAISTAKAFDVVVNEKMETYEKEITRGNIRILSKPSNANIEINGWDSGKLTPQVFKYLKPGKTTITLKRYDVRRKKWLEVEKEVMIEVEETKELIVDFSKEVIEYPLEGEVEEVIDGDTIKLTTGEYVRYIGIDTPMKDTHLFDEAKSRNEDLVIGREIRLEYDVDKRDKYNRTLAYVFVDGKFVNKTLVDEGLARYYVKSPNYLHASKFYDSEKEAKEKAVGLWSDAIPKTGTVKVFSDPSGADIIFDDEPLNESTPHTIKGIISGTHKIKVVKEL